jgi:hypothetical protein
MKCEERSRLGFGFEFGIFRNVDRSVGREEKILTALRTSDRIGMRGHG